jgi:nitrogen fixation protein NifB
MDLANHPCFNGAMRKPTARSQLPAAAKCNIQCKFCNRKYDCVNESRPGVTSIVLTPLQAVAYLDSAMQKIPNIAVVGIAGPGDPFANPDETMQTLQHVRKKYPDIMLCLATNGLDLPEYIDALAALNISHVTVTLNAVDPEIGAKIYSWIRYKNKVYRGIEGAAILLERQLDSIRRLKEHGITVKINTVIIPGINDDHAVAVAKTAQEYGCEIQNCIPLMNVDETEFADIPAPTHEEMAALRAKTSEYVNQMTHCARCRADAVGLIGEDNNSEMDTLLKAAAVVRPTAERPTIAIATMEGLFVNRHLGEASSLWIFAQREDKIVCLEQREAPAAGLGDVRWQILADILNDCAAVLVSGCGKNPQRILESKGLQIIALEGLISEALPPIFSGRSLPKILLRTPGRCCRGCTGTGGGCG